MPSYVEACAHGRWSLYLHDRKSGRRFGVPYKCRSWRHAGDCARHNSARIFARLSEQLGKVDPQDVLCLVLTFDRTELLAGAAMVDLACWLARCAGNSVEVAVDARWVAFSSLWRRWQSLRQNLHRMADRLGVPRARWALTVESHRNGGWPHCHIVMHWPYLADLMRETEHDCGRAVVLEHVFSAGVAAEFRVLGKKWPRSRDEQRRLEWLRARWDAARREGRPQDRCGARGCVRDWLSARAEASGFGRVLSVEVARDAEAAAGYIVKLAGEVETRRRFTAAGGELSKMSQMPVVAPRGFRRVRYSLRSGDVEAMLAPSPKDPNITGALASQPLSELERAIELGLDLVELEGELGEVALVPWVAVQRPRPPPDWFSRLVESAALRHLEEAWSRLYGPRAEG